MHTEHADDFAVANGDQIDVAVVKLIDKPAVARVGVLRDLQRESSAVETMNLLDFIVRRRHFEHIAADLKHRRVPPQSLKVPAESAHRKCRSKAALPASW